MNTKKEKKVVLLQIDKNVLLTKKGFKSMKLLNMLKIQGFKPNLIL